jgi:dihydrofolate reductase
VVNEFMSLDGIVQAPGGADEDTDGAFVHGGWSLPYFDPRVMGGFIAEGMDSVDALVFGRRTWQTMASAWPERAGDPYADQMNSLTKYVVSTTLNVQDATTWDNTSILRSVDEVAELRQADGRDLLVWGSISLVTTLLRRELVDEMNLMIAPITLGGGKRIFPGDGLARPWKLVRSITADTGVLVSTYHRAP